MFNFQTLHEEIAIVTNYLKIVCENLTHPVLIKSLMLFILNNLLPVLVRRMNHLNVSVSSIAFTYHIVQYSCSVSDKLFLSGLGLHTRTNKRAAKILL